MCDCFAVTKAAALRHFKLCHPEIIEQLRSEEKKVDTCPTCPKKRRQLNFGRFVDFRGDPPKLSGKRHEIIRMELGLFLESLNPSSEESSKLGTWPN